MRRAVRSNRAGDALRLPEDEPESSHGAVGNMTRMCQLTFGPNLKRKEQHLETCCALVYSSVGVSIRPIPIRSGAFRQAVLDYGRFYAPDVSGIASVCRRGTVVDVDTLCAGTRSWRRAGCGAPCMS